MQRFCKRKKLGMMRKLLLFFILFPLISFGQKKFFTNTFLSLDNENQLIMKTHQGYITDLDSLFKKDSLFIKRKTYVGISNGLRYYRNNLIEPTYFFNEAKIYIKSQPIDKMFVIFNPSLLISKNLSTLSYEFSTSYIYKKFYIELSSERDLIGARALGIDLVSNYHGISLDYSPHKRLTFVGSIQYNHITDNNNRWFYISRVIYTLPSEKIYFDFRKRNMMGGEWSPYYFSPETISQNQMGVGFNQKILKDKAMIKGYLGGGIQKIDDENMYLFALDMKFIYKIKTKLDGETSLGVRNFNKYIYSFGNVKLNYTF